MATFKLNDVEVPFEPGDTIMRAAWREGIEIPHYCWHPGLSIAANCRMCLIEIRSGRQMALPVLKWDQKKKKYLPATKPKLQPACQIGVQEGMEVYSASQEALEAQAAVQEFLLLNHPVDCPICDQAGECKLQDYWLTSQKKLKRKKTEPVHKPKGVRFGPTIVYDAERCIMCTRCIRFCDEVANDHVLDMRERGNRNEIVLSPGRELDNDYTLMTEHVCPVGALTSRDFRFKARVWFLRSSSTVCTGCAKGCNSYTDFDPRYQRVYRLRPRDNVAVNKYWMCDDGMMTYKDIHEDRLVVGRVREAGRVREVPRNEVIEAAAAVLAKVQPGALGVVLSAQHASEDNFVLAKLAREHLRAEHFYLAAKADWKADDILRVADQNPNRAGAKQVAGKDLKTLGELANDIESGAISAVLSLGSDTALNESELAPLLNLAAEGTGARAHVNLASNYGPLTATASVVVPVAHVAEMSGTFVNQAGTAQAFKLAIQPQGGIQPAWKTILEIGETMGWSAGLERLADVAGAMPKQLTADASETPEAAAPAE